MSLLLKTCDFARRSSCHWGVQLFIRSSLVCFSSCANKAKYEQTLCSRTRIKISYVNLDMKSSKETLTSVCAYDHFRPRSVLRQVLIVLWSNFTQLVQSRSLFLQNRTKERTNSKRSIREKIYYKLRILYRNSWKIVMFVMISNLKCVEMVQQLIQNFLFHVHVRLPRIQESSMDHSTNTFHSP